MSIDIGAFEDCSSLTSITIPASVTSISNKAFEDCSSLTSITIPASVTSIYGYAFKGCSSLKSIDIPESVTIIGGYAFSGCSSLTSITIPDGVTDIGTSTFSDCSSLTSITIPNSVTNIGESAFRGCSGFTSITIPNGVTSIGGSAFDGCDKISKIYISNLSSWINIDRKCYIPGDLYLNNELLTEVVIPGDVKEIGSMPLSGRNSIESIKISQGVEKIDDNAFSGCGSLESITAPNTITEIGTNAFGENFDRLFVLAENNYVADYCKTNGYKYYNRTAPTISKLASYNGSDIRVYIEKRENASGYQIKYADNSSMTNAKTVMLKDNNTLSKVISGFKNDKTYYVQLQTYQKIDDKTYWSKWSAAKSIKITQTPYNTNVSKLSTFIGSHIKVDWTKTAGASGYHIKYADNANMTGAKEVMVKGNSTFTKTLTGLKNGKTYYVKIQTYRTVSGKTYWSSWSKAKQIKISK